LRWQRITVQRFDIKAGGHILEKIVEKTRAGQQLVHGENSLKG
jgi:hypothetical protein